MSCILLPLLFAGALIGAPFRNLILNGDFAAGKGEFPLYWMSRSHSDGLVESFTEGGPDNAPFIRIRAMRGMMSVRQNYLQLAPGEKYILSGWFRSRGVTGRMSGVKVDPSQLADIMTVPPTQAEWKYQEKTIVFKGNLNRCEVVVQVDDAGGELDVARVSLRATTEAGDRGAKTQRERMAPSLVPLGLLRFIPVEAPELAFFWVGEFPGDPKRLRCVFTVKGAPGKVETPFLEERMTVPLKRFAGLAGERELQVAVAEVGTGRVVHRQTYGIRFVKTPKQAGRRLNNLVTVLHEGALAPGQTMEVVNPRLGWIFFRFQDGTGRPATLTLDGKPLMAPDLPVHHVVRHLEPGVYRLANVGAAAKGDVRLIPDIHMFPLGSIRIHGNGVYDWEFAKQVMLPALTTINVGGVTKENQAEVHRLGLRYLSNFGVLNPQKPNDSDDLLRRLETFADLKDPLYDGTTLDEVEYWDAPAVSPYVQALKRFRNPGGRILESWVIGPPSPSYCDYISTAANVSGGRGRLLFEVYNRGQHTEPEAARYLQQIGQHTGLYRQIAPALFGSLSIILGNFSSAPLISLDQIPSVDYRYYLDMQMHLLATDPRCDGLAGVGFWGTQNCDEEILRWCFALLKHYAVEGNTTMLSARYGYTFHNTLLKNGDFEQGLEGWQANALVAPASHKGYGNKCEMRYGTIYPIGDTFAVLSRTATEAGEVRQRLTGLVPGAKYSVFYMVADYDDILKGVNNPRRHPLELAVLGAEPCRQSYYVDDRNRPALKARVNSCKVVFIPESTEAELVFSVRHAEPGTRVALNYITVRRYFED